MHTKHRDMHEHGLADECPRCQEYVERPFDLDEEMLSALVELAVSKDRLMRGRSEAELVAAATVLTALEHAGRLAEVAPAAVERYLRDRWHLDVEISNPEL